MVLPDPIVLPQITFLLSFVVALASAFPRPDVGNPFLTVSIVRPGQSSVQTDVSRQAVSVRQSGEYLTDQDGISADQVCLEYYVSLFPFALSP